MRNDIMTIYLLVGNSLYDPDGGNPSEVFRKVYGAYATFDGAVEALYADIDDAVHGTEALWSEGDINVHVDRDTETASAMAGDEYQWTVVCTRVAP